MTEIVTDNGRREFLKVTTVAGIGLLVSCYAPARSDAAVTEARAAGAKKTDEFTPNAWLKIASDDTITIMINHSEMGQGITTGLSMIVAEELEADWSKIRTEFAPVKKIYKNPAMGVQATGGSTSVTTSWNILRKAGATAREILIVAAARTWGVPASECKADNGTVVHKDGRRILRYGEIASKTDGIPAPENVRLKKPGEFKIIGKRTPRLDTQSKTDGRTVFGVDIKIPGLKTATVIHPPVFGGKLKSFNAEKAKAVPGVRNVVAIPSGVAVVADTFWQAKKGADALEVAWDEGDNRNLNSEAIFRRWAGMANQEGDRIRDDGDAATEIRNAAKSLKAVYTLPYQAHACPEPMNCTAHVRKDGCDVWAPTQNQDGTHETAARVAGLKLDQVKIHTTYMGGGFGRRYGVDFVAEAVALSKAVKSPVQVFWTREEDFQHDQYRPAFYNVVEAGLDKNGMPVGWRHLLIGPAIMDSMIDTMAPSIMPTWLPGPLKNLGAKLAAPIAKWKLSGEHVALGSATMAYDIANIKVEYIKDDPGIPIGPWRAVGSTRNAFIVESFIDEIAAASGKDPFDLRFELLRKEPKRRGALKLAATKAGWGTKLQKGIFRGIAVHDFHHTACAMVAEVSVERDGTVKVHRVVCAVDCGIVVNPKMVEAQMAGGIVFGLTATLKSSVSIKNGRVEQSNFDDFPLLRMDEMPKVEVYIVPSTEPPTGIGEVAVPPIAPAVTNAVFAATGKRIRSIPIDPKALRSA
jgi:isoquinoline 1-oxidoreductase subunit beta